MSNFKEVTVCRILEILLLISIICLNEHFGQELYLGLFLKKGVFHAYVPIVLGLLLSDYFETDIGIVHVFIFLIIGISFCVEFVFEDIMLLINGKTYEYHEFLKMFLTVILGVSWLLDMQCYVLLEKL